MGQRTCPHCGTTNVQSASDCSWCGRSLDDDATQPIGGVPPAGEQPTAVGGWQRGEEAPPGGSWEPASAQRSQEGAWEPTSPAQPAEGAWAPPSAAEQPQGGSWQPPPSGGGWEQPAAGWWESEEAGQDAPAGGQPAWGGQGAAQGPWGTTGQAAPRQRGPLVWVAIGVAVVLVLAGIGVAAMSIGGQVRKVARSNDPLQAPASIGGFNRIDTGAIRSTLDQQSSQLRQKGARNFVVAAYGTETLPEFVLVAVREANDRTRQDITAGFDEALVQQTGGAPAVRNYRQGEVDYRCTSSRLGAVVAICRFNDGDVVGFGFSGTQTPQRVSQFTAEARDKMK